MLILPPEAASPRSISSLANAESGMSPSSAALSIANFASSTAKAMPSPLAAISRMLSSRARKWKLAVVALASSPMRRAGTSIDKPLVGGAHALKGGKDAIMRDGEGRGIAQGNRRRPVDEGRHFSEVIGLHHHEERLRAPHRRSGSSAGRRISDRCR